MNIPEFVKEAPVVLTEGAILERLQHEFSLTLDPHIANASLLYDKSTRKILENIYLEYIAIGEKYNLPIILTTPTWKASATRIEESLYKSKDVNTDAVNFLKDIRATCGEYGKTILIAGLIGPIGDAYKPENKINRIEAARYHTPQVNSLTAAGVDFLIATTIPSIQEGQGLALAMQSSNLPYIISFFLSTNGNLADGTTIKSAIDQIDTITEPKPLAYFCNCVHPETMDTALAFNINNAPQIKKRLVGFQGNTASGDLIEIQNTTVRVGDTAEEFAHAMLHLYRNYGLKVLGGCCGTTPQHMDRMAELLCSETR